MTRRFSVRAMHPGSGNHHKRDKPAMAGFRPALRALQRTPKGSQRGRTSRKAAAPPQASKTMSLSELRQLSWPNGMPQRANRGPSRRISTGSHATSRPNAHHGPTRMESPNPHARCSALHTSTRWSLRTRRPKRRALAVPDSIATVEVMIEGWAPRCRKGKGKIERREERRRRRERDERARRGVARRSAPCAFSA